MTNEEHKKVQDLLIEKNYIGAYEYVKALDLEKADRSAEVGSIVSSIVEDLGNAKQNKERVIFLRSLLSYIFKEYPGLGGLYKDHLRMTGTRQDLVKDFLQGLQNIGDVITGQKSVKDSVDETVEDVKNRLDEKENPLADLAKTAGESIVQGLDSLGNLFQQMSGVEPKKSEEESETKSESKEEDSVKIKIENADDPLPNETRDAGKSKDSKNK